MRSSPGASGRSERGNHVTTMRNTKRASGAATAAVAMAWLLGGCLSVPIPQAEADPSKFYVLSPVTAAAAPEAASKAPALQLQPVEVASYLRARTLIVRRSENEVQFREFARWGEPLELGIARVLREELLARGAAGDVLVTGGFAPAAGAPRTLAVRVLACEGGADGSVHFRAMWELAPKAGANDGAGTARGDFRAANLRWDGKNEASLAAGLSAAVAGLAAEIATATQK